MDKREQHFDLKQVMGKLEQHFDLEHRTTIAPRLVRAERYWTRPARSAWELACASAWVLDKHEQL